MKNLKWIRYELERIKNVIQDVDVVFVDMTRESIGIPAVKVIVPTGLQSFGEPILVPTKRLLEFQKIRD